LQPRLTLRVGVTGHRLGGDRLSEAHLPAIEKAVTNLLILVRRALDDVLAKNRDIFSPAPPVIRFISPLAAGADQTAAKAARAAGAELECPLPFARRDYARDFKTLASRRDFYRLLRAASAVLQLPGRRRDADEAYETVGLITLRRSDILIAIWDGNLQAPLRGGTAEMVIKAFDSGIPILWLHPSHPKPRLLDKQASAVALTLWELVAQGGRELNDSSIRALVDGLTAPPKSAKTEKTGSDAGARTRLRAFLGETEKSAPCLWLAYPLLLRLLGNKRGAPEAKATGLRIAPVSPPAKIRNLDGVRALIDTRYGRADRLSVHLGQVYRSGYVMNYLLAALAVFFALAGIVWDHDLKPIWTDLELAVISFILAVTLIGNRLRWHERWLDYRQLAEQLRHLRFLCFAGARTADARVPHVSEAIKPGPAWASWYYRASLRELPLLHARVDEAFVGTLNEAVVSEIEEQAQYHALNAHRLKHVHEALHRAGNFFFVLTAAICLAFAAFAAANGAWHFAGPKFLDPVMARVSLLGGLLPAIGAALYGIRIQGDFKAASERSAAVAARLSALIGALDGKPPATFAKAAGLADEAAAIMSAELSDWSMIFREKPLSLPA